MSAGQMKMKITGFTVENDDGTATRYEVDEDGTAVAIVDATDDGED